MGFECQSEIGLRDGKVAENSESAVGMLEESGRERVGKRQKKAVSMRRGHECIGVPEHLLVSRVVDRLGRMEVRAC